MEDRLLAEVPGNTSSSTANLNLADDFTLDLAFPLMGCDFNVPSSLIQMTGALTSKVDWFLAPETWRISHQRDTSAVVIISKDTMKMHVVKMQSWFERWVTTGSNPFIHSFLYSAKFPAYVQVAYATLASYIHRTPANTDMVLQIVENRSNDLLRENGAVMDRAGTEEWVDGREQDIGLFTQLGRLHALMVYQSIGLYDGDIRARHVAQGHIAVQDSWAGKLVHAAAKTLSNTNAIATHLVDWIPGPLNSLQQQWNLWILSESIRRTWLVSVSLTSIFLTLQQRWKACPGGVMYTNRVGLWDAASAAEWEKQCLGRDVAFLQRFHCGMLFTDVEPADVDEFGIAIVDMTFNSELVERWKNGSSSS